MAEFWESSRGAFTVMSEGEGITAPPERGIDRDGRIGRAVAPLAPAAAMKGDGAIQAGFGSFCWPTGQGMLCADSPPPGCGDGFTPMVLADAGGTLAFDLPFMPASAPVVTRWEPTTTGPAHVDARAARRTRRGPSPTAMASIRSRCSSAGLRAPT